MNENFLLNDKKMNNMIEDIIDIFNNVEGVQLVRLSGLSERCKRIANLDPDFPKEVIDRLVRKLKYAGIINYHYITNCPHCQETSYQVIEPEISSIKLCDTCNSIYTLISGITLYK